jgi:hypothetical protein
MKVTNFFAASDLAVIDRDPEMADMSNPRGEIIGYASYVYADSEHGDRRRKPVTVSRWEKDAMEPAEALARSLNARLAAGKMPVGFDRWEEARPGYGSDAYVEYGQADDVALERREAEEEMMR